MTAFAAAMDALFADPKFYGKTPNDERRRLEAERGGLVKEAAELTAEWEKAEETISAEA